jgi:hypothetical protein
LNAAKKELGFNPATTLARFPQMAAEAGDALLTEGYVQNKAWRAGLSRQTPRTRSIY